MSSSTSPLSLATDGAEMRDAAAERTGNALARSLDTRALASLLYGGDDELRRRADAHALVEHDRALVVDRFFDVSEREWKRVGMRQMARAAQLARATTTTTTTTAANNDDSAAGADEARRRTFWSVMSAYDPSLSMRFYVHNVLFDETLRVHGSDAQYAAWRDDIASLRVIGCFAMTELGHSSNLRQIETTATYDARRDEFVVHTEALTGTKWWIGGAGHMATHTVCLAQLVLPDCVDDSGDASATVAALNTRSTRFAKSMGIFWFIVPLRDPATGRAAPGVRVGLLGAKAGRRSVDNGWIQFDRCRVPRSAMLSRFASVSADGRAFSQPPSAALAYSTLIGERIAAMAAVLHAAGAAAVIATRYAAVRRQGEENQQILDYPTQQAWVLPALAGSFFTGIAARLLMRDWQAHLALSQRADALGEFVAMLPDWHALAAGCKCVIGWWCSDALEACRRAMGGHAYSSYNALPQITADYWVVTTGGGDNVVLGQQCASYLLACARRAADGKSVQGAAAYFCDADRQLLPASRYRDGFAFAAPTATAMAKSNVDADTFTPTPNTLTDVRWLSSLFAALAVVLARSIGAQRVASTSAGASRSAATADVQLRLLTLTRAHVAAVLVRMCADDIDAARLPRATHRVANCLLLLFAHELLAPLLLPLAEHGFVDVAAAAPRVRSVHATLLSTLRRCAVVVTDAFDLPDWVLKAPVARRDGDVYRHYMATVAACPDGERAPYWDELVKPLVTAAVGKRATL